MVLNGNVAKPSSAEDIPEITGIMMSILFVNECVM